MSETDKSNSVPAVWHRVMRLGVLGVVIVGVLLAGAFYFTRRDHAPAPHETSGPAAAMPVGVLVIEPREIPIVGEYLAQTEASEIVPIRARVSGFLNERGFEDGDTVEQGQVLFRIDSKPFEVALRRAEAGLSAAEAQLLRADQQVKRFSELAELQQAAANELEQAQEAQRIAAASVETQRAQIAQAKLDLDYATVTSPITGVIGTRQQDVGSYVGPSAEALLATVRKVDPLYVRFSVSERDLLRWKQMQEDGLVKEVDVASLSVEIVLPDGRTFPQRGRIDYVDVVIDPSTGTALIRASVPNPENMLRPGQFVHARVHGVIRIGALVVPQSAVLQSPNGASVYIVDEEGLAQMRPVVLGDWVESDWIVLSGLETGDRVIVDHLMTLRPGTLVETSVIKSGFSTQDAATESNPD